MPDGSGDLNQRIADRVSELRAASGFSLEALAERSAVSRSMISLIERGESSPTAAVLEKLTRALGVPLASLFDAPTQPVQAGPEPVLRYTDQPVWKDPLTGYVRRNVSPAGVPQRLRIVEIHFPPGERVSFEPAPEARPFHQQFWLLEGLMDVHLADAMSHLRNARYQLKKGDCIAVQMDEVILLHNPGKKTARYAVMTVPIGPISRRLRDPQS